VPTDVNTHTIHPHTNTHAHGHTDHVRSRGSTTRDVEAAHHNEMRLARRVTVGPRRAHLPAASPMVTASQQERECVHTGVDRVAGVRMSDHTLSDRES
jgi:hypothetical protein